MGAAVRVQSTTMHRLWVQGRRDRLHGQRQHAAVAAPCALVTWHSPRRSSAQASLCWASLGRPLLSHNASAASVAGEGCHRSRGAAPTSTSAPRWLQAMASGAQQASAAWSAGFWGLAGCRLLDSTASARSRMCSGGRTTSQGGGGGDGQGVWALRLLLRPRPTPFSLDAACTAVPPCTRPAAAPGQG
jgi:hypothetical protein